MRLSRLRAVPIAASLDSDCAAWRSRCIYCATPPCRRKRRRPSQLSVYSPQTFYTVPLLNLNGQPYVGLVELLEPLGNVDARPDGKKYKLKFTPPGARELEFQFQDGKDNGKVKGDKIKLPSIFAIQSGRGYVPLSSVSELLSRALSTQIRLNPTARRLFIGNVGERFTLDLRKGEPSKLFVSFDSPVNPTIATEPGHIRFTFRREPVTCLPWTTQPTPTR